MENDMSTKNAPAAAPAIAEKPDASALHSFPFCEEGKVPQYQKYHAKVSYLDELELIWGKRWGAQGIGRLREVAMVRPTETVHGTGVCEIGASTRMSDDFIVLMLSTDCNRESADQVIPILHGAGYSASRTQSRSALCLS